MDIVSRQVFATSMKNTEPRKAYQYLYRKKEWKQLSTTQLAATPYCEWCREQGMYTPATICHHTTPHRGDVELFFNNVFVSLCKTCHDSEAQQIEKIGYSLRIGVDGLPIDKRHPFFT